MHPLRLFFLSLILTMAGVCAFLYTHRSNPADRAEASIPQLTRIADGVFITSQLESRDVPFLKADGYKTIVDIRPDGEALDQASSSEIGSVSKVQGIGFHYVPVPHESIPDAAVNTLTEVLSHDQKPTVLYCRTGRRAVRTFALAQASRTDGPDADAILLMVRSAGFSAGDLKGNIDERIAHRNPPPPANSQ